MNIVFYVLFLLYVVFSIYKYRKLKNTQKYLEDTLIEAYKDSLRDISQLNDQSREDFIKFLSDSREWAFNYIEEVQAGLDKFVEEVDGHITHFDKFGDVLSTERADYVAMKQISKSYKELKNLLPKEGKA